MINLFTSSADWFISFHKLQLWCRYSVRGKV